MRHKSSLYETKTNAKTREQPLNEVQEPIDMMPALSRFIDLWQLCAARDSQGFKAVPVKKSQAFLEQTSLEDIAQSRNLDDSMAQSQALQSALLSYFYGPHATVAQSNARQDNAAQAGLCLRCYISEPILKACQKIDHLFKSQGCFTYRDLLPFVLNDDGRQLIVLDAEGKTQLLVDAQGTTRPSTYSIFAIKVLQTFQPNLKSRMSLDNWTYLQTKQNPEIKKFLSEFGFQLVSDWALLNRVKAAQLEQLSERDQQLVKIFHAVYRRDRHQQQKASTKCQPPSPQQIQEMVAGLEPEGLFYGDTEQVLADLKKVATQLRQYDIWGNREPLDVYDSTTQAHTFRTDLPQETSAAMDVEQQEFVAFLNQQLMAELKDAIAKCIGDRITTLTKSSRYRVFSQSYIPGLKLYYQQSMSLREIATHLKMTSWDQARRILNPGELLSQVRTQTIQHFLEQTLAKAQQMGLAQNPPNSDYLSTLIEQIEAFADTEVFQKAAEELHAGKNRSMNSIYAQQLRLMLETNYPNITAVKEYDHA
jgi:hypothetical protein